jgi:hypothetical protein
LGSFVFAHNQQRYAIKPTPRKAAKTTRIVSMGTSLALDRGHWVEMPAAPIWHLINASRYFDAQLPTIPGTLHKTLNQALAPPEHPTGGLYR